jgi:hypothetical protein
MIWSVVIVDYSDILSLHLPGYRGKAQDFSQDSQLRQYKSNTVDTGYESRLTTLGAILKPPEDKWRLRHTAQF